LPVEPLAECGFTISAVSVSRFLRPVMFVIVSLQGKFRYNFIVTTLLSNSPSAANNNDNHNKTNKTCFSHSLKESSLSEYV
jgi:hypothetical protein